MLLKKQHKTRTSAEIIKRMLLWILAVLLLFFSSLDVWYFLRAVVVVLKAWFQPPVWDVLAEQSVGGRVLPHDIDMGHMNNARYLRECDFARFSLYTRNGVFKATRALGAGLVVGASTIRYRRALSLGEAFELRSRIVTWDEKSFFLEQRFVSRRDEVVSAVMLCRQNVLRSSPDKILQFLCKRKVERPEFPEDLQHWISFIAASSQSLKAENTSEEKSKKFVLRRKGRTDRTTRMLLWILAVLLLFFSSLDVWYFLRAVVVVLKAWFQPPVWDVLAEQSVEGRVLPHDIDYMGHMNNARYLRECDFARFAFYTRNGLFKAARALGGNMVVGASTIRYRRSLALGEAFELRSRIVAWDEKSFFLEQRFVSCRDGFISAVMLCRQNILRSSPDKILQFLCKRKVESPEFPEDLQHWISFIAASSQSLRAENTSEEKSK
ncbi:hypothetical protein AGOR_G00032870 [Albula goreensis]|uniref:Protein THEM6 n=1 Tax=Albula goreensis TaxID=1534307 RepID=A0A8T3E323_9TELE|nr:hypothetical protein AGOR_G00032870 [Albula goreensis]